MDENSVCFFLILLFFITIGSEFKQCQNNTQISGFFGMRKSQNLPKLHKALRSVQFLASFIRSYFEMLSYPACYEKIIRLASKNSVKLGEKSASDFKSL